MKKRGIGGISSIFVSIPGIVFTFCLAIFGSVIGASLLAGFCMFLFLLFGSSRLWGSMSVKNVSVSIEAASACMFIGENTDVSFHIKNAKMLPLIWMELLLPMPRRGCIMPDGEFEEYRASGRESGSWEGGAALKKKFSFIMGHDAFDWKCVWNASSRGVYRLGKLVLRSGDGFGLTQSQTVTVPEGEPIFAVYPAVRPVDITPFLMTQWDGFGASGGFMDDLTVMRGQRRYEAGDSWKRINWRMAARGQELITNLYDTITPKAIHFALDGESFIGNNAEFEDALSLLASVLVRLSETGVMCGLSLPRSRYLPQTDIPAKSPDVSELLLPLADYDMLEEKDEEQSKAQDRDVFFPSDFDYTGFSRVSGIAGRIYYIVRDAAALRARPLPTAVDTSKLVLLAYRDPSDVDEAALGLRIMKLRSLGR